MAARVIDISIYENVLLAFCRAPLDVGGVGGPPSFGKDRTVAAQLQDRMIAEADARTPDNRFAVHNVPGAGHLGPEDPARVAEVLHGLPV